MFCVNCETTVQNALLSLPGVQSAAASFTDETVTVTYDAEQIQMPLLRQEIETRGYQTAADYSSTVQTASVLIILLAVYVIADHLGWTQVLRIYPVIGSSLDFGMLFVIGLLTSVHCAAMCGGINLIQSAMAIKRSTDNLRSNLSYHAGRVISYTLIGGAAGALGSVVSFSGSLRGIIAVIAGIIMIAMALSMLGIFRPLRRLPLHLPAGIRRTLAGTVRGKSSFVIGLLNGFIPCGPLQSMQIYALSTGSLLKGAASMLMFSLGTVPLMLGIGLFSGRLNRKHASVMLTVSALLIFIMGVHMTGNGLALSGVSLSPVNRNNTVITAEYKDRMQYVKTVVDYGSYEPFTVRKDIPVEWTIEVPLGKLNGCNEEFVVPAYDISVKLHEGENIVHFTPHEAGTIPYTCWMGMIKSYITVTS